MLSISSQTEPLTGEAAAAASDGDTTMQQTAAATGRTEMRPVKYHYADSFWCTYLVSVFAASIAETVTYPLDLTKTRLQIQGEAAATAVDAEGAVKKVRRWCLCVCVKCVAVACPI